MESDRVGGLAHGHAKTGQVLALSEALDRFAADEPRKADLVTLRFFGGLSMPQVAEAVGVSLATAERWWAFARSWLYTELQDLSEDNLSNS